MKGQARELEPVRAAADEAAHDPDPSPSDSNGRPWLRRAAFALVLVALAAGLRYYLHARHYESTDDAFVDSAMVEIAPQISGRVTAVHVRDNQWVDAGAALVEIDAAPYRSRAAVERARLDLARAGLEAAEHQLALTDVNAAAGLQRARADVAAAEAEVERARAEWSAARAEAQRAESDSARYQGLDPRAVSVQQKDQATAAARAAAARANAGERAISAARAKLDAARARLEAADTAAEQSAAAHAEVERSRAEVERAKAALEAAELDLSYVTISAPVGGHVVRNRADVGEYLRPGQVLMALVPKDVWVTANFKETQLTDMRPGQAVELHVDAYPDHPIDGRVDSIQRGTGAHFSLFPPENATGSYVKVVQRVPVKIVLDEDSAEGLLLAPGMSVVPSVRVR